MAARSFGATGVKGVALLAATAFLVLTSTPAAASSDDDVSALLRRKTQVFSDAGQRNDVSAMTPLLDDRVVFFNEGGDRATKAEMIAPGPAPAPGTDIRMTVSDWTCERHGDVAVTSFVDEQAVTANGETTHARYRSVETWLKEGADWRMIASQTLALQDDPAAAALPAATLDEYVGVYRSAAGTRFVFTRRGDALFAAVGQGPPTEQKAEVRDVVFTPGRARFRKVFQRDAAGRVTAFAYRHEGHDTIFQRL